MFVTVTSCVKACGLARGPRSPATAQKQVRSARERTGAAARLPGDPPWVTFGPWAAVC